MVVVLLAFSATGSLQCSARCPGLARRRQLGAPESQQRWLYQRDVVEKRAGPVLSVDPTSASRAVRMISSCRNSATLSREHSASTRPAWLVWILASRRRSSLPLELPREYPPGHKAPRCRRIFIDRPSDFRIGISTLQGLVNYVGRGCGRRRYAI